MLAVDVVDQFLAWMEQEVELCTDERTRESKASTLGYYRIQLAKLKPILPGGLPVADLDAYHLEASRDRNKRHFRQAVKRTYRWAWDSGRIKRYCTHCPLESMKLPRARGRKRVLKAEEFEAILRASLPWFQEFIWCAFRTGARPLELRRLRWPDVDFAKRVLRIEYYKGKLLRADEMEVREIPFDEEILELLQARQREQNRVPQLFGLDGHVFTGRHGQRLTKSAVCWNFRQAAKRAGIDQSGERAVPYTLRHTCATTLTVLGMGQKLLADVLGHSKVSTTERYQHACADDKVAAVDRTMAAGRREGNPLLKVARPMRSKVRQLLLFE